MTLWQSQGNILLRNGCRIPRWCTDRIFREDLPPADRKVALVAPVAPAALVALVALEALPAVPTRRRLLLP